MQLPREIQLLADRLARVHGPVHAAQEKSGVHLYMASPVCLERFGPDELRKRHLAVNADRYLGLGSWVNRRGTYNPERSAVCMKTRTPYKVDDLLHMAPLEARNLDLAGPVQRTVPTSVKPRRVEKDALGIEVPLGPGDLVSLDQLPDDHPAVVYVRSRNYSVPLLVKQFQAAFCVRETPEDRQLGPYYRRLPGGFKDTPQGRLILSGYERGSRHAWQARILELEDDEGVSFWHPYDEEWVRVILKDAEGNRTMAPGFDNPLYPWKPSKYKTGDGVLRADHVLGFDAAVEWNEANGLSVCLLCEGPLDAARIGPPGIPIMGKFLAPGQAALLKGAFRHWVVVTDNDSGGDDAWQSIRRMAGQDVRLTRLAVPPQYKDLGLMPTDQAFVLVMPALLQPS